MKLVACLGSSRPSLSLLLYFINQLFHHSFGAILYILIGAYSMLRDNLLYIPLKLLSVLLVLKILQYYHAIGITLEMVIVRMKITILDAILMEGIAVTNLHIF